MGPIAIRFDDSNGRTPRVASLLGIGTTGTLASASPLGRRTQNACNVFPDSNESCFFSRMIYFSVAQSQLVPSFQRPYDDGSLHLIELSKREVYCKV